MAPIVPQLDELPAGILGRLEHSVPGPQRSAARNLLRPHWGTRQAPSSLAGAAAQAGTHSLPILLATA